MGMQANFFEFNPESFVQDYVKTADMQARAVKQETDLKATALVAERLFSDLNRKAKDLLAETLSAQTGMRLF